MARRKSIKYKHKQALKIVLFILVICVVICGRFTNEFDETPVTSPENYNVSDNNVYVHIIDVGQGSSALVQCGNEALLIDGGEREYGRDLVSYISKAGVTNIKYIVASHPHTDHIGGLLSVLDVFEVENVIMPVLSSANTPTTKTYERFLLKIKEKDINVIAAKYEAKYYIENVELQLFSPLFQYSELNNMSVLCKITAFTTKFLFPGDASVEEMADLYAKSSDFSCDVMAAAHHGSRESLHKNFLLRCNPKIVVYSCSLDNSYGHPHSETVDFFNSLGVTSYKTCTDGTLVFDCSVDGYEITKKGTIRR